MTETPKRRREFDTHIRLDPDIAAGLKVAVEEERMTQTWIVNRAIREWLERRRRQARRP